MGIQTLVAAQSDGWMRSTLQHLRRVLGLRLRLVVVLQATTKEQQREEIDNLVRLATIKLNGKILASFFHVGREGRLRGLWRGYMSRGRFGRWVGVGL